jgi:tRNA(fMet)-specific endonuclease VapC
MYLLDTNACIRLLRNTSPALIERSRRHDPSELKLCSVVRGELVYGALRSARPDANLALLRRFLSVFECLPFDEASADHYGSLRVTLEQQGRAIGPNDLMIAAIARAHNLVLVTHNTRELSRVPDLKIEDWETA